MDMDEDTETSRRVHVRFITKLKPPMKVPSASLAIPANLTRLGLSSIVNNLLKSGNPDWESEAFDFIIDGELIRMSLEDFLLAKGIFVEKMIEIEYIRAIVPRKEEEPCLHDDWVSAANGSNPGFILTGCYDSFARVLGSVNNFFQLKKKNVIRLVMVDVYHAAVFVGEDGLHKRRTSLYKSHSKPMSLGPDEQVWRAGRSCTHILEGHNDAVTSISIVNPKGVGGNTDLHVATASKDRTLRLWKFDVDESLNTLTKIRAYKILRGHTSSVQSVASQPSGEMVCSGSWDSTINLWRTNESDPEGDVVSTKKRKVNKHANESQLEGTAVSSLVGHTQCVSSVIWPENETIYSASWDHSIRRWDAETGKDTLNVFCGKALNCLDVGGESSALIVAGGSDQVLRIWDPRKPGTLAPVYQFAYHASWITACKWHDSSWLHLLSASYDGKVMLWDLRTSFPLATIDTHKDKVLCADWWKGDSVVSGGADSKLCISSEIPVV